jgi:hypothetical protein
MCSYNRSFIKVVKLLLGFIFLPVLFGDSGEISKPVGSLSILLPPGTTNSPSYTIAAAGLKSTVVFRGQVKQVSGNDIVFDRVPDLLDPTLLSWPFKDSMLATIKARAHAVLDSNRSIASITWIIQVMDIWLSLKSEYLYHQRETHPPLITNQLLLRPLSVLVLFPRSHLMQIIRVKAINPYLKLKLKGGFTFCVA